MSICAALVANRQKYHTVSQLHPLDDWFLGVSACLANGHTCGTVYVPTYVQTQYYERRCKKTIGVGSRFKVRRDNISSLVAKYPDGGFMR